VATRVARQTPAGARPNRRREAVLFDEDAAGRPLEGAGDRSSREMTVRSLWLRQNPAYRPGDLPPRQGALLALAGLLVACSGSVPRQPVSVAPTDVAPRPVETRWRVAPDFLSREYRVEHVAEVRSVARDVPSVDSVSLVVTATRRLVEDGSFAGLVESAVVRGPGSAPVSIEGIRFPFAYVARGDAGFGTVLSAPTSSVGCSPTTVVLGALRDLFVTLPDSVYRGVSWREAGSYTACREGVPLSVSSTHDYTILGRDTVAGQLLVRREATIQVLGQAFRGTDTTTIRGSGSGSAVLRLSAQTGMIEALDGNAELELAVTGAVRREDARQISRTRVRRLAASP
jgi:hypothetical protein